MLKRYLFTALILLGLTGITWAQSASTTYELDESRCGNCHANTTVGNQTYNIYTEFMKTGHPYKLNEANGHAPVYPANTTPGVPNLPIDTLTWDDIAYVIGGYGWKARFVKQNGFIFTDDDSAQYNLYGDEAAGTKYVAYHLGEAKKYDYNCFKCHTTGPDPNGSWPANSTGFGTFVFPGVRCQGCHGPAKEHADDPNNFRPPVSPTLAPDSIRFERCGDCHQRGGRTNNIPASGGFVKHHEQFNEMQASKHRTNGNLTCATCHDTHIADRYANAAGAGLTAITKECSTCHPNHDITITNANGSFTKPVECVDCHMAKSAKSALGTQLGNGWEGDIPNHLWAINTAAVTKDAMFTSDGLAVQLDGNGHGAITLDFACLKCHQDETVDWASTYAAGIHTNGITAINSHTPEISAKFELKQNYPNPFNPTTTIEYTVPLSGNVKVVVYDITGRKIRTLVNEYKQASSYQVTWDGRNDRGIQVASGVYFYALETKNYHKTRKMVLTK